MVKPTMARVDSSSCCNNSDSFSSNNIDDCKMYKGVRKRKWGKWVSEIRLPNSRDRIWLGSYDTQAKAARAFDAALYYLRGKSASFNFPDTPRLLGNNNMVMSRDIRQPFSHEEIQEVAVKFANNHEEEEKRKEKERPLESQSEESNKSNNTTISEVSNFPSIYDIGGIHHHHDVLQVDQQQGECDTMDWTFLNTLDDLNGSDFGLYLEPDKIHHGEFLCPMTQAPLLFHGDDEIIEGGGDDHDQDAFSNHSFLWSWNF